MHERKTDFHQNIPFWEKKKKEKKKIETQILSCVLLNCVSNDPRKGLDPGPVHRSFTDHNHHSLSVAFLPCPK